MDEDPSRPLRHTLRRGELDGTQESLTYHFHAWGLWGLELEPGPKKSLTYEHIRWPHALDAVGCCSNMTGQNDSVLLISKSWECYRHYYVATGSACSIPRVC